MPVQRVKPSDVSASIDRRKRSKLSKSHRNLKKELKRRRQTEVRVHIFNDQKKIIDHWCNKHETSVANLVRKLLIYWIYMNEKRRQHILRNY